MRSRLFLYAILCTCALPAVAQWHTQDSGTDVSLRGISAVSAKIAWASGAKGAVLRTRFCPVPGTNPLLGSVGSIWTG